MISRIVRLLNNLEKVRLKAPRMNAEQKNYINQIFKHESANLTFVTKDRMKREIRLQRLLQDDSDVSSGSDIEYHLSETEYDLE